MKENYLFKSCEEGLKQILFNAYKLGTKSLNRKDICNQAYKLNKSSFKTVDNTLGAFVNKRILVRPKRRHYALAPPHLQHLISLHSTGGKESNSIDITSVVKVPDSIPKGKRWEISKRLYLQLVWTNYLPSDGAVGKRVLQRTILSPPEPLVGIRDGSYPTNALSSHRCALSDRKSTDPPTPALSPT